MNDVTVSRDVALSALREANVARQEYWGGSENWTLADWSNALAGEVGEACNLVKKLRRPMLGTVGNDHDPQKYTVMLASELGDVLIYLDLLANAAGLSLSECVLSAFNEKSEKLGMPVRLSALDLSSLTRTGEAEPVAWPEWATDKHIAEGILNEAETILQLAIHDHPEQIAEHTGAIKSYAGTLLGRESRRHLFAHPATPVIDDAAVERAGIYVASKVKHAEMWRDFRTFEGMPIISTWIDEQYPEDMNALWQRCVHEASTAAALILYRRPDEVLKGAWIELGAALASGVPVFAVGIEEFTIAKDKRIQHFPTLVEARRAALLAAQGRREE